MGHTTARYGTSRVSTIAVSLSRSLPHVSLTTEDYYTGTSEPFDKLRNIQVSSQLVAGVSQCPHHCKYLDLPGC